ncbi:MAG: hypothetical protein E6713_05945 [Sporomusaceae bacterium]|nr:hypothetical protein [Sporomusaceae bacterium]
MPIKQIVGLLGSIMLIVGTFSPIVKIPIVGEVTYFQNGQGDGVIVLGLGIISLILVFVRYYNPLIATGLISFGMVAFTFFNFQNKVKEIQNQMSQQLRGNPFKGIAETMINSVQIEWGFALVIIGAIFLIVAPFLSDSNGKNTSQTLNS